MRARPSRRSRSAARIMKETGARRSSWRAARRWRRPSPSSTQRGIPVIGHVGLTPQAVNVLGGYGARGSERRRGGEDPRRRQGGRRGRRLRVVVEGVMEEIADRGDRRRSPARPSASAPRPSATARCWSPRTCSACSSARRASSSASATSPRGSARPRAHLCRGRAEPPFPTDEQTYRAKGHSRSLPFAFRRAPLDGAARRPRAAGGEGSAGTAFHGEQRLRRMFGASPDDGETFLREVDDELRREQMRDFISAMAAGWSVAVVLLLARRGGYIWWQGTRQQRRPRPGRIPGRGARQHSSRQPRGAAPSSSARRQRPAGLSAPPPCSPAPRCRCRQRRPPRSRLSRDRRRQRLDAALPPRGPDPPDPLEFDSRRRSEVVSGCSRSPSRAALVRQRRRDDRAWRFSSNARRPSRAGLRPGRRDKNVPESIRTSAVQMAGTLGVDAGGAPAAAGPVGPAMTTTKNKRVCIVAPRRAAIAASGCGILKQGQSRRRRPSASAFRCSASEGDIAGRSDARRRAGHLARAGRQCRLGAAGRQCRPSRSAMSRSGQAPAGPGPSSSASGSSRRAASPRRRSSPTAGSTRSTRGRACARSTPSNGALVWAPAPDEQRQRTRRSTAAASPTTTAASTPPTASAMSPRWMPQRRRSVWMVKPGGPLRGAPTVASDTVYVISQDNQLYRAQGRRRRDPLVGRRRRSSSPACSARRAGRRPGTLVAGFSSGELNAYRYENGQVVAGRAGADRHLAPASSSLSDIDADPVIDNGRVFAIGQGGRMVAVELITGQRDLGTEYRRHLDALGRGRLGFRGHRRRAAAVHLSPERPHPLDQPATAKPSLKRPRIHTFRGL